MPCFYFLFSVRKHAEKATSTVKFIAKKWKVECAWMRIVARNRIGLGLDVAVTRPLVRTLGKWKIGQSALIRAVQVFNIGESLVIGSTLMNGSIRSLYHSDATLPKGRQTCKNVVLEIVMLSTCGEHQLGSLARPQSAAVKVLRNVH